VTFEEGTCAAWLHDLLKPHVTKVVVCDPRKNALLKGREQERPHRCSQAGRSSVPGQALPVYHGENGIRTLKELARSYLATPRSHAGDEPLESPL
jgi:hypothetical protein